MAESNLLAVDLGASNGRALHGKISDGKLILEEIHRFPNRMQKIHGHYFWDIFSLFDEAKTALGICGRERKLKLDAIAFDTWGVDFGLLDKSGKIIGIPYAYRDPRTDNAISDVTAIISKERVYQLTGISFWPFNSLYQLYVMSQGQDPYLKIADTLLFMPDLLNYMFSGVKAAEHTIASTSQLMNPVTGKWEDELFRTLKMPRELMQEIVQSGQVLGQVTADISEETGIGKVDVTSTASHDTAAAIAAIPAVGENWAYISSGTWSLMGIESDTPILSEKAFKYNFTNEGGVGQTTRFLKNIMGLWLLQECKRSWEAKGQSYSFPELVDLAAKAIPFKALLDADWLEFFNPPDMPAAIDKYCEITGQAKPSSVGEYVRTILEGLALKYRQVKEQLEEVKGSTLDTLHIIGGGVQNKMLCQFAANATGMKVVTGPAEATGSGNIMMQAMAKGLVKDIKEVREIIRASFEVETYRPSDRDQWNDAYGRYREMLAKNS